MKKLTSILMALLLTAGALSVGTAAADAGDVVYCQTFDNVASYDDLGWEICETLTANNTKYSIEDGKLMVDNMGGGDTYTIVAPASLMDEVNKGDYTVQYDFEYLEAGDTGRYLAMLLNYDREIGNTYNSLHIRVKGYADWQNRFGGTWSTNMDLNGGYNGLPVFTNQADESIITRVFGVPYDANAMGLYNKPMRIRMEVSNSEQHVEIFINDILISGTDEAGWDQFTWASEDYSEVVLKAGASIKGTVDNIVIAKGLGIPEGTVPALGAASEPAAPVTYTYPASGLEGKIITGEIIGNETGWGDSAAAGRDAAFDGNPATFFDPLGVGDGFCGVKADEAYVLEKAAILSRSTYADRFLGAMIQGSNDGENWTTLWESDDAAASTTEYTVVTEFENNTGYTMYRYFNETSHGDVAEVEFYAVAPVEEAVAYTYPASGLEGKIITGEIIGNETGWGDSTTAGRDAGFDGNPATFFDPLGVGDGFLGIKAGEAYTLEKVAILSREGYADRFLGAMIQGSNDGESWTTLWTSDAAAASTTEYTVVTEFENNTGYTMYRYFNETSHGDVAEVEFYAAAPAAAEAPVAEEAVEAPVEETIEAPAAPAAEAAPAVEAPATFDAAVVAAVAGIISLAGFAVSKKR